MGHLIDDPVNNSGHKSHLSAYGKKSAESLTQFSRKTIRTSELLSKNARRGAHCSRIGLKVGVLAFRAEMKIRLGIASEQRHFDAFTN